jgi:uncharacterized phiE125 gp8 family phage protein
MSLVLTTPPTIEPVSLDEIKLFARLAATTVEDALLNAYISVARNQAENYTHRQINKAVWQYSLDDFPAWEIRLPRVPLLSTAVTISFTNSSHGSTSVDTTFMTVDTANTIPRVYPSHNSSNENAWDDLDPADIPNNIKVSFTAGYSSVVSTATTVVPEPIKQYIKLRVATMYKYRESITTDQYRRIPKDYHVGLLDAYVIEEII